MNIERINVDSITDIHSAKRVIAELLECMFEMNRQLQRQLNNLGSQQVRTLDFNVTKVSNIDNLLSKYATKEFVNNSLMSLNKE